MFALQEPTLERLSMREWYLANGSIVRATSKEDVFNKLCDASMTMNDFYAYNVDGDLWEVQFSKDVIPHVTVLVRACSGFEASVFARSSLLQDRKSLQIIHVTDI